MFPNNDNLFSLNVLPDDCLVIVFRKLENHLDRKAFGLTCRRWLQIENSARTSLQLDCHDQNSIRYLPTLLRRFPQLSAISLAGCTELPDSALTQLQTSGLKLQTLSLYCCFKITDNGLSQVSAGCPSLVSISLYRCNITDAGLEILARCCSALECVNLSFCMRISDSGIRAISRGCAKLCALTLSYCKGIEGTGLRGCSSTLAYVEADSCSLTREGILSIVSGGGLQYLNVSIPRWRTSEDGLGGIGYGFASRLRFLNLRLCRFVGDESVETIAMGCPLLEEWNLAVCHEIRVRGWRAIGLHCQNLEILHVNRCRCLCDAGLQALREGCNRLTVLYIDDSNQITTLGLESFKRLRWDVKIKREECVCVGTQLDFSRNDCHPFLPFAASP